MNLKSAILFTSLFLGFDAFAFSEVTISPGGEVLIRAGETVAVRCSGEGISDETVVCDCYSNNIKRGEVVGSSDHGMACRQIHRDSAPMNCRRESLPLRCDCYSNNIKRGEVVGSSDLVKACKQIHRDSAPMNCVAL